MSKFEEVEQEVIDLMNSIIESSFSDVANARIKVLYFNKRKMNGDKIVFGYIKKTSDLEKYFTSGDYFDSSMGYNYIMFLDVNIFNKIEKEDKIRIIRHELSHILIDLDSKNPYKLIGHDIEDFYKEIEYNKEDLKWKDRIVEISKTVYDK